MTLLIVLLSAMLAITLWTGTIAIYFSAVNRDDNPVLYWFQIAAIVFVLVLAVIIKFRGGE